jgi:hypothetical protein
MAKGNGKANGHDTGEHFGPPSHDAHGRAMCQIDQDLNDEDLSDVSPAGLAPVNYIFGSMDYPSDRRRR